MVVDSSAIVAILLSEADADFFEEKIASAAVLAISAPTFLECSMVMAGRKVAAAKGSVGELVARSGMRVVAFDEDLAESAFRAFQVFGKRRHKANLNFGDCMSYATAKALALPLLCKGEDFAQTDLPIVSPPA